MLPKSFENTELENVKTLPQGKNHREQAHAFVIGAVDAKQTSLEVPSEFHHLHL